MKKAFPQDAEAIEALRQAQETKEEEAIRMLRESCSLKARPETLALIHLDLSDLHVRLGNPEEGLNEGNEALSIAEQAGFVGGKAADVGGHKFDPWLMAHESCCFALLDMGDPGQALMACNTVLGLEPTNYRMLFARGVARRSFEDRKRALEDFEKAAELSEAQDPNIYERCREIINGMSVEDTFKKYGTMLLEGVGKRLLDNK